MRRVDVAQLGRVDVARLVLVDVAPLGRVALVLVDVAPLGRVALVLVLVDVAQLGRVDVARSSTSSPAQRERWAMNRASTRRRAGDARSLGAGALRRRCRYVYQRMICDA
jgi:hypothetical protein